MQRLLRILLLVLPLCAAFGAAPATIPPEFPVEKIFGQPAITQIRFSPDGRYIAALQPWEHRLNLIVVDLRRMQKTQITSMKEQDVSSFFWASNDRIIFAMDEDGQENFQLFAVNADGTKPEPLNGVRGFGFVSRIRGDNDNVVIQGYLDAKRVPDLYYFNLRTGRTKLLARNPGSFQQWLVDHAGVARFGMKQELGVLTVSYRDDAKSEWTVLGTFRDGEPYWFPLEFDGDDRTVFVASNIGRKTLAIQKYDARTRQLGDVVHADDTYDVAASSFNNGEEIIYNDGLDRVVGLTYQGARRETVWIDPTFREHQRALDRAFPDTLVRILEASSDNSRLLVVSYSDRVPGEYFLYDTKKHTLEAIASVRPELTPSQLAPMHPFAFTSRDGLKLHGYLTLPVGREMKNLPLIVHPHGGPYGPRDTWGFNPEVQFYANRGFAVLQLDYRGSGGYGDWFERAGYQKWGLEMQNDLTDAVKWVVGQGIADPKRVVISGASYGGYATMAGLVYTPELYCAGINYVGVTDLMEHANRPSATTHDGRNFDWWLRTRIGDPYKDAERIKATSPSNFIDRIRVPLLMGYGLNDPRVPIIHGSKVLSALKAAGRVEGRDFWYFVERYEGHGFAKEENRIAFYKHMDEFLKTQVLGHVAGEAKPGELRVVEMPAKGTP
jgi:dipeptidyl aminopeptidase/acylaminoacyl peptidase